MSELVRFPWHPPGAQQYMLAAVTAVLAVGVGIIGVHVGVHEGNWLQAGFALVFLSAAVCFLIDQNTLFDTASRTVCREGRLFGRFRVWHTVRSIDDFTAVVVQRTRCEGEGNSVFIGLRRRNGRFMAVRYFHAGSGEAEQWARYLADVTGLKLDESDA